jgi:hypothetical protein
VDDRDTTTRSQTAPVVLTSLRSSPIAPTKTWVVAESVRPTLTPLSWESQRGDASAGGAVRGHGHAGYVEYGRHLDVETPRVQRR